MVEGSEGAPRGDSSEAGGSARALLHDGVAARLRDLIVEGRLAPGERLNERVLCERFAVSRTPLREAIRILVSEGLVELKPHRGAVVSEFTTRTAEETFEVLAAIEALAGRLACARASEADLAEIRALHFEMRAEHARGNLSGYFRLNQRIHARIVECAGNAVLESVFRQLNAHMLRARYMANLSRERWDQAVGEHERILEALCARDPRRLETELGAHLRNKYRSLSAELGAAQAGSGSAR